MVFRKQLFVCFLHYCLSRWDSRFPSKTWRLFIVYWRLATSGFVKGNIFVHQVDLPDQSYGPSQNITSVQYQPLTTLD